MNRSSERPMSYAARDGSARHQGQRPSRTAGLWACAVSGALAFGAVLAACAESSIDTFGGPLSVTVTAEPNPQTVGEDVTIRAAVQGTSLEGVILDYGDGQVDSFPAFGANTQTVTQFKAYDAAGSYTVLATAEDPSQGTESAQVVVTINP